MESFPFLFAAYSIMMVCIFGYLLSLHLRQRRLNREIEDLRERLEREDRETRP
jgi:CcmD family protein